MALGAHSDASAADGRCAAGGHPKDSARNVAALPLLGTSSADIDASIRAEIESVAGAWDALLRPTGNAPNASAGNTACGAQQAERFEATASPYSVRAPTWSPANPALQASITRVPSALSPPSPWPASTHCSSPVVGSPAWNDGERALRAEVEALKTTLSALHQARERLARRYGSLEESAMLAREEVGSLRAEREAYEVETDFERRAWRQREEVCEQRCRQRVSLVSEELERCQAELRQLRRGGLHRTSPTCAPPKVMVPQSASAVQLLEEELRVARSELRQQRDLSALHERAEHKEMTSLRNEVDVLSGRMAYLRSEIAECDVPKPMSANVSHQVHADHRRVSGHIEAADDMLPRPGLLDQEADRRLREEVCALRNELQSLSPSPAAVARNTVQTIDETPTPAPRPEPSIGSKVAASTSIPPADADVESLVLELCDRLEEDASFMPNMSTISAWQDASLMPNTSTLSARQGLDVAVPVARRREAAARNGSFGATDGCTGPNTGAVHSLSRWGSMPALPASWGERRAHGADGSRQSMCTAFSRRPT